MFFLFLPLWLLASPDTIAPQSTVWVRVLDARGDNVTGAQVTIVGIEAASSTVRISNEAGVVDTKLPARQTFTVKVEDEGYIPVLIGPVRGLFGAFEVVVHLQEQPPATPPVVVNF